MTRTVNFLPWRQSRQRKRLRRGCLAVGAVVLMMMMAGGSRLMESRIQNTVLASHVDAERQLIRLLSQREEWLKQRQQVRTQQRREQAARQQTLAWQVRLVALAERLPAQAWLTGLTYQGDVLSLSGVLARFSALHDLDDMMKHIEGFQPAVAGKMARDKEGRWLFNYQMKRRVADAAP